jgi:hypothetical protein
MVGARGPFWLLGPWQLKHIFLAGFRSIASFADPCASWQLKQVTPRVYIRLCTKSFPCIRFLWAVPSGKCVNEFSPSPVPSKPLASTFVPVDSASSRVHRCLPKTPDLLLIVHSRIRTAREIAVNFMIVGMYLRDGLFGGIVNWLAGAFSTAVVLSNLARTRRRLLRQM